MARVKKRGLDYFPLDTQFVNDRIVRRVMKLKGDAAMAVLVHVYSAVYAGEGYYVEAGQLFFEDVADSLFTLDAAQVADVVMLAMDFGLFHRGMYERYGILTSEAIQRQFLFCTRRRKAPLIDARFNLLPPEDPEEAPARPEGGTADDVPNMCTETPGMYAETPENAGNTYPAAVEPHPSTQSIAQQSKEKHSTEKPPLQSPPPAGKEGGGARPKARESRAHVYTQAEIDAMVPPADGVPRNHDGQRDSLRLWHIPLDEQYAIIRLTGYGAIGHPVWQGFYTLRASKGKIRQAGKYLLSLCHPRREQGG